MSSRSFKLLGLRPRAMSQLLTACHEITRTSVQRPAPTSKTGCGSLCLWPQSWGKGKRRAPSSHWPTPPHPHTQFPVRYRLIKQGNHSWGTTHRHVCAHMLIHTHIHTFPNLNFLIAVLFLTSKAMGILYAEVHWNQTSVCYLCSDHALSLLAIACSTMADFPRLTFISPLAILI